MERMEVDQCAGAAGGSGGGALRRSNSAPMITSVSDALTIFSPVSSARYRRSSVSINPSCPSQPVPPSPFLMSGDRAEQKRLVRAEPQSHIPPEVTMETTAERLLQEENMEMGLRGNLQPFNLPLVSQWDEHSPAWFRSQDSGVTPNSSPSPTRRFRPIASGRCPVVVPLKRKGGAESDGPPKKLFVAGIADSAHHSSYTVSVSQSTADSPPAGGASPLSPSPPHSFTHFSHQRPRH